ncbi:MAG TPA: MFS transporter, partial [Acidobacteria bacterium]|nr:MFS transporter [Acidobacteriota bacterium]
MSQTGLKTFGTIWIGQLVSLLGSGLTTFALGIWALERTGSVTRYALIIVLAGLPSILIGPFAGALVDRWDRRLVMLWTDLGPAVITLSYAFLLYRGELQVWHIYIGAFLNSVFSTFQWPAYSASITMLVEPKSYGRAYGMMDFGEAGTTIAAPALAGLLLSVMDIWGVLLLDFVSFLFAAVTLLLVRIPRPAPAASEEGAEESSLWKDAAFGWHFIRARPGLLQLLFFFATVNLAVCTAGVALLPMVLGFTGSKAAVG